MKTIEEMLSMSERARSRLRPFKKRRKYNRENRSFSDEELLEYLRKNNIQTIQQLESERKAGEPRLYDYRKAFKYWNDAKKKAFGIGDVKPEFDAAYVLKCVVEFDLWTVRKYKSARRKNPDIFPSFCWAKKKWGGYWSILKGAAKQYSLKATMDEYVKLWRKLRRVPTMEEVKREGIVLESAIKFYKSKKELDKVMIYWGVGNAKKARGSRKI